MILLVLLALLVGTYAVLGVVDRRWAAGRLPPGPRGRISLAWISTEA